MDYEAKLRLQAYLDGELPQQEAGEVARLLANDQEAAALLGELRSTREAMAGGEAGLRLPESREFYWSKLKREIERLDSPAPEPERSAPFFARLGRFLVPATALALLAMVGLVSIRQGSSPLIPGMQTTLEDSGALTYHDYSAGTTLVWLTYPADNEVAENDEMGTLE